MFLKWVIDLLGILVNIQMFTHLTRKIMFLEVNIKIDEEMPIDIE